MALLATACGGSEASDSADDGSPAAVDAGGATATVGTELPTTQALAVDPSEPSADATAAVVADVAQPSGDDASVEDTIAEPGGSAADGEPASAGDVDDSDAASAVDSSGSESSTLTSSANIAGDTTAGIQAAQWSSNVSISWASGSIQWASDGLPSHEVADVYAIPEGPGQLVATPAAEVVTATPVDVTIPLNPVWSETPTDTPLGTIGVMVSGAVLFNDYEGDQVTVALDDNFVVDGAPFVDACNGHPVGFGGSYHYHGVPYCITDAVDTAGQHSTIIGLLLDGFPIYGPNDVDGARVTNADLDECGGHVGPTPEFPDGIYHYHLTDDEAPYSIDCFHGEIDASSMQRGGGGQGPPGGQGAGDRQAPAEGGGAATDRGGPPGGLPDFGQAAAALGISEQELIDALGTPPDLAAAATTLGISLDELTAILPPPPGG